MDALEEVRQTREAMLIAGRAESRETVDRVEDLVAGGVPVRLYVPDGARRTVLFAHGGGFVYGEPDTHDAFTRRLANATRSAVVFVDYRRAPEHPFPAAVDDVRTAHDWLLTRDDLPGQHVVLGDSAGANLALGLALRRPAAFARQVLVYPFVDPGRGSYDASRDNEDLSLEQTAWFWDLYAPDPRSRNDPALDPASSASFAGLPPTLIQLAERDVLHSAGSLLADRMADDGVTVEVTTYGRVPHGFWRQSAFAESFAAVAEIASWLER